MIQVRCHKCSATLALKQAPTAGKVKCPKCAAIIAVGNAAPVATPQVAPKKPVIQAPPAARSHDGEIDFRSIPTSPAPNLGGSFPMPADRRIYDGPIALDPIPKQKTGDEDEDDDDEEANSAQSQSASKSKKSKQSKTIIGICVVALLLVAGGGVAFWKFGGGGGRWKQPEVVQQQPEAAKN